MLVTAEAAGDFHEIAERVNSLQTSWKAEVPAKFGSVEEVKPFLGTILKDEAGYVPQEKVVSDVPNVDIPTRSQCLQRVSPWWVMSALQTIPMCQCFNKIFRPQDAENFSTSTMEVKLTEFTSMMKARLRDDGLLRKGASCWSAHQPRVVESPLVMGWSWPGHAPW